MARDPRACPGTCDIRYRDAWDAYDKALAEYNPLDPETSRPEQPSATYVPGEPVWCEPCAGKIGLRLAELDDLAGILAATADGHREDSGFEDAGAGSPADPASPSRAADDLDEMHRMLSEWEAEYRKLKGWQSGPPRDGELASRETACIDWLRRHLRGILVSGIAADFGREILQWHREFAGSAKAGTRKLTKPLRCPRCKLLTLTWTEGEDRVTCGNPDCLRVMDYAEYEAETAELAGRLDKNPAATEAA